MFELFVTWIEEHIFDPVFSISYIFISIIQFFCCFFILEHLFTWNHQKHEILIQHHLYTNFDKVLSFSCFIFSHTRLQHVTLITRKGVFIFHISGQDDVCIGIGYINKGLKEPLLYYHALTCRDSRMMWCMFPRVICQCLERIMIRQMV